MNERKKALLSTITKVYIKTAKPVGSNLLVDKYHFNVSPATIRNEMMQLEEEGYVTHPHTSAGRVPTEKGYRFYIDNFLKESKLSQKEQTLINRVIKASGKDERLLLKNLAKVMAELSDEAVFIGFSANDVFYTGISNLFRKPEYASDTDMIINMSQVIDHFDEVISQLFDVVEQHHQILIGKDNPFGAECSSIITKYRLSNEVGLIGILGPMRMNYQGNYSLIKHSREVLKNI